MEDKNKSEINPHKFGESNEHEKYFHFLKTVLNF